jgi:hypothetical protein
LTADKLHFSFSIRAGHANAIRSIQNEHISGVQIVHKFAYRDALDNVQNFRKHLAISFALQPAPILIIVAGNILNDDTKHIDNHGFRRPGRTKERTEIGETKKYF